MQKKRVNFRLDQELIDRLSETASGYRGVSMTNMVEISLDYLLSLPKPERDEIIKRLKLKMRT
jgi:hypothetical protein